ncbi:MAG TPA: M48 family metallopeptidase [Opitutaceae bacterium]|nr:M48 family metallopeptidase [Opitutaceae bacterium]
MKTFAPKFLLASLLTLAACTVVPETGRRQIMLVSPTEEAQMGLQAFADVKSKEHVSTDPKYNAQVHRIGERIAASVGRELPNAQWEYVVLDSEEVNAFALPGGKVAVYTGLLKLVKSDDELACVMGHEIAHVTSRHGAERTSQNYIAQGAGELGALYMNYKNVDPQKQQLLMAGYGIAANVGALLPYSRLQESEADSIGLRFAAQAGYDPRAAVTFWQRMSEATAAKKDTGILAKFLSTHPPDAERIANLQSLVPKYLPVYEAAKQRYQ